MAQDDKVVLPVTVKRVTRERAKDVAAALGYNSVSEMMRALLKEAFDQTDVDWDDGEAVRQWGEHNRLPDEGEA